MAREHARLLTAVWFDEDWRNLGAEAQRVYMLAISQQDMTYAGVVPYRAKRWAELAKKTTAAGIRRAVSELESAAYVVTDEATEELLVRTFIRHDRVLAVPNVARAMVRAFRTIASHHLRDTVLAELARDYLAGDDETRDKGWTVLFLPAQKGGMREHLEAAIADRRTDR
jgi:hypothetical protein